MNKKKVALICCLLYTSILSKLSGILADNKIGIFAVSTFNTDYILVKDADFEKSLAILLNAGYTVI